MNQVIVSANDAVGAKLVEQAGFDGIWVSGFESSVRLGLPDNGSITMTEMLNIVKPIVEAVKIPVWVDCDTGYGNLKRTIREFERIGAYGICVEDNIPQLKINSLWGDKIPLMSKEEFGEKLNCVAWDDRKIKIMARTEANIRGYGLAETLTRIEHYKTCGADVVMPHTRDKDKLLKFKKDFPVAIVPTTFSEMTNQELFAMGYSMVIWANQTERVRIKSVREMLKNLKETDSCEIVHRDLSATLDEMRGLTDDT